MKSATFSVWLALVVMVGGVVGFLSLGPLFPPPPPDPRGGHTCGLYVIPQFMLGGIGGMVVAGVLGVLIWLDHLRGVDSD